MLKFNFFKTLTLGVFVLVSLQTHAQSLIDPGISSHNYKMPNKAKFATGAHQFIVTRQIADGGKTQTPKYAAQASTLFEVKDKKKVNTINPLAIVANYKTQAGFKGFEKSERLTTSSLNQVVQ